VKVTGQAMAALDIARDAFRANEIILYRPLPYRLVNDLAGAYMSWRVVNEVHMNLVDWDLWFHENTDGSDVVS
jgi:hypothetical protein